MDSRHRTLEENPEVDALKTTGENVDHLESMAPREKVTRTILLCSAFIAISAAIGNFDNIYGVTILQMKPFNTAFGTWLEVPGPTGALINVCRLIAL